VKATRGPRTAERAYGVSEAEPDLVDIVLVGVVTTSRRGRSMPQFLKRGARRFKGMLLWSLIYPFITAGVLLLEYRGELSKIGRGFFTDTFSPYLFTHLLTFPASSLHSAWQGYPADFDTRAFRVLVAQALPTEIANILFQYTAVVAFLFLVAVCMEWQEDWE
jgi:hypothetical protein